MAASSPARPVVEVVTIAEFFARITRLVDENPGKTVEIDADYSAKDRLLIVVGNTVVARVEIE